MQVAGFGRGDPVIVTLKLLADGVEIPDYAKPGDAACDLRSTLSVELSPLMRTLVPTGIALEIPEGYAGLVTPRSGMAANFGIMCLNSPGLIDSGYRGEIKVVLYNSDPRESFTIHQGDRIAQLFLVAVPKVSFMPVEKLSESARGAGGFGHTGV